MSYVETGPHPGPRHQVAMSRVWEDVLARAAGHANEYLSGLTERPVGPSATAEQLRELLGGALPDDGEDSAEIVSLLAEVGQTGTMASAGPRFFGFVMGGSVPAAVGADWLVSTWDQNAAAYTASPATAVAEEIAADWVTALVGLPDTSSVGFVTGGQMATFTALAAARHHLLARSGWDVEARGLHQAPPVTIVASEERHASIDRALRLLGLGTDALRLVRCDSNGAIDPAALREALTDELTIVCVQAGNINTGAIDPLDQVCEIAHSRQAWVHVDGAVGLWAAASPRQRPAFAGLDRADSWSTDGHKWLNVPYDCGVVICAHPRSHRAATGVSAPYIVLDPDQRDEFEWTPEWSRRARSLPLYAAIRSLGRAGIVDLVERCCAHARRFADQLATVPGVQILNDVVLNQVLVRFDDHDEVTSEVIDRVQRDGTCWLGGTTWREKRAMRISVCNWSTTEEDVDESVSAITQAYRAVHDAMPQSTG